MKTYLKCGWLVLLLATQAPWALAQKKPGGPVKKPANWAQPRYDNGTDRFYTAEGDPLNEEYWKFPSSSTTTDDLWWVFANKAGISMHEKPDGNEIPTPVNLGDRFFVFQESGAWLQVGRDHKKPPEGWCHKKDLVLWSTPLVDPRTTIELKAFFVNTLGAAQEVQGLGKDTYQVWDGPGQNATKLKDLLLYDVLYVYGYVGEGADGRFLVSAHNGLSPDHPLLGWVSRKRVKVWTTRLCLEPNFDPPAMAERRSRKIMARLFAQGENPALDRYLRSGEGKGLVDGKERDPALNDDPKASPKMNALLFRYPVFGASRANLDQGNCSFITGVSGKCNLGSGNVLEGFNEDDYLEQKQVYEAARERAGVVNVVFVVEGSADAKDHFNIAKSCVQDLQQRYGTSNSIRYGAVVYRNEHSSQPAQSDPASNYIEELRLTNNADEVVAWWDGRKPYNAGDPNDARAVYWGLKEGIKLLRESEVNILVHLGRRPDNTRFNDFFEGKTDAKESLFDGIGRKKTIHYLGFVTYSATDKAKEDIRRMAFDGIQGDVMQDLANKQSNLYKGSLQYAEEGGAAVVPELSAGRTATGIEGAHMTRSRFAISAQYLTSASQPAEVQRSVVEGVGQCLDLEKGRMELLAKILEDKSRTASAAGDFTYDVMRLVDLGGGDPERFRDFAVQNQVHLFADAKTFYRVAGMRHPLFKYVLFYSEKDLNAEIKELDKLIPIMDQGQTEDARVELSKYLRLRAQAVLGSEYDDKVEVLEIRERLLGIHKMDMVKPFEEASVLKGLSLEDLSNSKKFTLTTVYTYLTQVRERLEALRKIVTMGDYYQVPGDNERKYYWVPIELLFD